MEVFLSAWFFLGFTWWAYLQFKEPFPLGFIGDILIGLPFCLLAGPIPYITDLLETR